MKKYLILSALITILAFPFSGCTDTEDYLVRKDGVWNVISVNERTYRDGELLTDVDSTEGLGSVVFNEDGTGANLDANGNQIGDEFAWSYSDFGLTITQDGEDLVTTVLESSKKAQRWVTVIEEDLLGFIYRTETTTLLELEK